jgi:hypothetical protein
VAGLKVKLSIDIIYASVYIYMMQEICYSIEFSENILQGHYLKSQVVEKLTAISEKSRLTE